MGFGKILGLAVLGVGAIAAAPFTGGGSIFGAATLAGSLAGAGAIAAATGAGAIGAGVGYAISRKEEEEEQAKNEKIAKLRIKAEKFEEDFKKAISQFQGDKEYFNYIIAATAAGIAIANADGEISNEELTEINEFIGGAASLNYPEHIITTINKLKDNPPSFNEAMKYLEKVNVSNYESIRSLIELVIEADEIVHEKEKAFVEAFDSAIKMVNYKPESNDTENKFILELQSKFAA
ncbi:MAG: TerB family tellurite resistance protein [Arcobacteraceae bacterium]